MNDDMCRWLAYSGISVPLSKYVTEPSHSLISQSLNALESAGPTNGDGFGLGWYGAFEEPGLYREVRPAWSDENLQHLCRHIQSSVFFGHVRAATATPVTRLNCHPFAYGKWLFMHNGFVSSWPRLRRNIEAMIPDSLYACRAGTTDSEAFFLAMLGYGLDENPIVATGRMLVRLQQIMKTLGDEEVLRFTAALSDGTSIYAFRYAVNDKANSLYYRNNKDGIVIASEPLDEDRFAWTSVPENNVLIVKSQGARETIPFAPSRSVDNS